MPELDFSLEGSGQNQPSHRGIRRLQTGFRRLLGIPAFLVRVRSRYDWESYVRLPSSSNACGLVRQRTWVMDGRQGAADPTRGRGGALSLLGGGR